MDNTNSRNLFNELLQSSYLRKFRPAKALYGIYKSEARERQQTYRPGGVGLLLIEVDTGHASPGKGVAVEQLAKELCHVSQLVCLQSVDCRILKLKQQFMFMNRVSLVESDNIDHCSETSK